jgi:large subunit ribosomal protein L11
MQAGRQIAGVVSVKHVYEIAKLKIEDINCAHMGLQEMCHKVVDCANRCGIKVVNHDLDPEELREFLTQRKETEKKELQEIAEKKAARMMKAAAAPVLPATPAAPVKK